MASGAREKDARPRSVPRPGGKRRTTGAGETSERTFRAIFSAAPDPILLISLKPNLSPGLILEANPAAARLFGYSREELLRRTPQDIADPALVLKLAAIRKALLRKGRCTFPARVLTKAGRRLEVENNLIVFSLARRKVLLTICRDLSERRRMEKALRESEKKYRNLFDNLPQKVFYKNARSVYLAFNPSFAADFKIPPEEIEGKTDY
ncbi:MAG: PAS domain S-box protein, partial [Candidatus Aureabacteria bacterium]|nr:PAS domain S-box protein [Candidatus Auribacterota bacterium]